MARRQYAAAAAALIATDGVRSLVREGKTAQILNLLQTGKSHGMTSLENELIALAQSGQISAEDAVGKANRPDEVRRALSNARTPGNEERSANVGARPAFS